MKNTIDALVEALEDAKDRLGFYQRQYGYGDEVSDRKGNEIIENALAQARAEKEGPSASMTRDHEDNPGMRLFDLHEALALLEAAPQPPAQAVGLTDERIRTLALDAGLRRTNPGEFIELLSFARAVEANHSIKPPEKGGA